MHVTFRTEIKKTTNEKTMVYLWAHEGWWIFTGWWDSFILRSEYVPVGLANKTAEDLLKDAEKWYQIYKQSPSEILMRRSGESD